MIATPWARRAFTISKIFSTSFSVRVAVGSSMMISLDW